MVATGYSGYTTWALTDDGVLTVSPDKSIRGNKHNMKNYWKVNGVLTLPWSEYADMITSVVIEDGVTAVGQMAFYGLENLESVTIAGSVTEIRTYAYKNCTGLTSVTLNEGLEVIREGAFYGCTALEYIEIPENVIVESYAFSKVPGYQG